MRRIIQMAVIVIFLPTLHVLANPDVIKITDVWINEAPPVSMINAAYLLIANTGNQNMTLNKVSSPDYERIEIHRSVINDGRALMQMHTQLEIKANNRLQFTPGDFHLMLFNPGKLMRAGDTTSLTFHFSDGRQITVDAKVKNLKLENTHHH